MMPLSLLRHSPTANTADRFSNLPGQRVDETGWSESAFARLPNSRDPFNVPQECVVAIADHGQDTGQEDRTRVIPSDRTAQGRGRPLTPPVSRPPGRPSARFPARHAMALKRPGRVRYPGPHCRDRFRVEVRPVSAAAAIRASGDEQHMVQYPGKGCRARGEHLSANAQRIRERRPTRHRHASLLFRSGRPYLHRRGLPAIRADARAQDAFAVQLSAVGE